MNKTEIQKFVEKNLEAYSEISRTASRLNKLILDAEKSGIPIGCEIYRHEAANADLVSVFYPDDRIKQLLNQ